MPDAVMDWVGRDATRKATYKWQVAQVVATLSVRQNPKLSLRVFGLTTLAGMNCMLQSAHCGLSSCGLRLLL